MKKVVAPRAEPQALTEFRAKYPDGTWKKARSGGRRAFGKKPGRRCVFDALAKAQGYICAYCESSIGQPVGPDVDGSVEHFIPESTPGPPNYALDFGNMLACCEGGTVRNNRREEPISETKHCGHLKAGTHPNGRILDPRKLPVAPSIWRFGSQGGIAVDEQACRDCGLDPAVAHSTIRELGLDRRGLCRFRATVLQALDEELDPSWDEEETRAEIERIAQEQLIPVAGRLSPFWSAIRWWAGAAAEDFLQSRPALMLGLI